MTEAAEIEKAGGRRPCPEARRAHILDAACDVVRKAGFHGASMAEIAAASGFSVGQIYRYFENKEAIIAAIADRDLAEIHEKFDELEASAEGLAQALIKRCSEGIEHKYDPARAALMLEVMAEAARNPRVAAIIRDADVRERQMGRRIFESAGLGDLDERELAGRLEVLNLLFDGMVLRAVSNPDGDRAATGEALRHVMLRLLSPEPMSGVT